MTIEVRETVNQERLNRGKELFNILNELDNEAKNALIGHRCVSTDLPDEVDDDLKWVELETTLTTLSQLGICFIDEHEFQQLLSDIRKNSNDLYADHRAWSILTVLELIEYEEFDESFIEAYVLDDGEQRNETPIDCVGRSSLIELFTCKFNVTKQHKETREKSHELREVADGLDDTCLIGLGTLSVQIKERILPRIGDEFDKIITGRDILDFTG